MEATLVGILTSPSELEDTTPMAVFPPSILTQGDIGLSASVMAVDLADGSTPGDLQADVAGLADASAFRVDDVISADLVSAVHGQAVGLWLLAGLGALAAVAAAGYLLSRNVKLTTDEELSLQALGATRVHRVVESAARAASVMAFAIALGWVIAIALSGLFPFGFAERMEPHPGLTVHVWLLLAAGLVMGVAVTAWVAVAALLRARHRTTTRTPLIDSIASRCPRASMATGVRFAFSARPGESARVTLGVVGTAAVVAALIGSLTFAAGMHELVDDPTRQGDNYDIAADNGAERIPDDAMAMLADSPAVQSVELYTATQVEVGGTSEVVALSGHEPFRGEPIDPVLLDGRQPIGDDEIALGRVTAHRLGLSIGDDIDLADDDFHATYRITGIVVPTAIGGNDLLGQGAVVTARGYDRLDPQREPHAALVDLDRAAPQAAVDELAAALGGDLDTPRQRPPAIISMSRITFVPYVLALLLAALATIVLAGAVYSSIRRRDHQVAVLRALGADRRWLIVSEAWHAAAATIVPTAVGVPIGLIAGRLVFRTYADDRGMVSTPVTPVGLGLGLLAALLVAAVVAALLAGRPARRTPPAVVLRTA
ncbi:MAG: ABC transporter permease [Actinobacteria bacterium]|nr:ABC transporter permease [Actinomycetota bacterium]